MAALRWPEDAGRLDLELMRESPVTRYRARDIFQEHLAWLDEHGYQVHTFDCFGWRSEDDFHDAVSRTLRFPDYYGRNLDAFNDCLCAINVPEEGGIILAFLSFDVLHRLSAERAWHILDIIARWSRFFLLVGKRLMALVQSDDTDLRIKPVGARPVILNSAERTREMQLRWEAARGRLDVGNQEARQ